jgi:RNA-dependent RNA polymerase
MGDLDGDTYMVIWDKDIVDGLKENHDPSDNVKVDGKEIRSDDPIDHIINYMQKDNLGQLCNLHMALCDSRGKEGPKDKSMIELSSLI